MQFLQDAASMINRKEFFRCNLKKIFQVIVVPGVSVTEEDQEEYEDDPV